MPVYNSDIVDKFHQVADLLEIEGANPFRVRAYRKAARTVGNLSRRVEDLLEEGKDLTELSGIGEDLSAKIREIVETGTLQQLEELTQRTPPDLSRMLTISGLGPKRVAAIYESLGVKNLDQLQAAARKGEIQSLDGLGPKTEEKILQDLQERGDKDERMLLSVAEEFTGPLVDYLQGLDQVNRVEVAGSYRRRKETVGDLDILVISEAGEGVIDSFVNFEDVDQVISEGETRSSVILRSGLQVDLRVVPAESYGAALMYFTGSKSHNIALRDLAQDQDLKINEYGVFRSGENEQEDQVAGESEEEIYGLFDLPYILPELRENRGEIEAAERDELPELVTLEDIRGDLQSHTQASDGRDTLEAMARAARDRGYDYFAVTDHSSYIGVTQGLDEEELGEHLEDIQRLDDELGDLHLLKSIEVDILEDGSLDLSDQALAKLDVVVASIHSHFDLPREKQTERVLRAMDNPQVNILGHPTGRRINSRSPFDLDLARVMDGALERGCYLEVNAQPGRLDLKDTHCQLAKEKGLQLVISTDAHSVAELNVMRFGVDQARRGWLTAEDVLNTRGWEELKPLFSR